MPPIKETILISCLTISLLLATLTLPQSLCAEKIAPTEEEITLPAVVVAAELHYPPPGVSKFSAEDIEKLPVKNNSITELLKVVPGVQFSEEAEDSFKGGEIKPTDVSISGGRGYENDFLIDGISNSSKLDPANKKIDDINNLSNSSQEIYISPHLLKSLTVYDHNISARYGRFTGGVVEAETIDPTYIFTGRLSYKTTRDKWTEFYVDPGKEEDFEKSTYTNRQPHFEKQFVDAQLGGPINEINAFLVAYSQSYAQIPLEPFGEEETQTRRSKNYLLKHLIDLSNSSSIKTTGIYAPYEENYFLRNTKSSNAKNRNDTYSLQSEFSRTVPAGQLEIKGGVRKNINERFAPDNFFSWKSTYGDTKDWGLLISPTFSSNEGGFGDLRRSQQTINLQGHWEGTPTQTKSGQYQITSGFDYEYIRAKYSRPKTVYSYKTPKALAAGEFCAPGDIACVDEEQYLSKRLVYAAGSASERMNQAAAYAELSQTVQRLFIRPGFRLSYDDLMGNLNIAPRLKASLDLFGNGKTTLTTGVNRYYGQNLLSARLREAIPALADSSRTSRLDAWSAPNQLRFVTTYEFTDLKTPYSDEFNLGISQQILNSMLSLTYVQRQNKDQLARENDPVDLSDPYAPRSIRYNNNGYSNYQSYRLNWDKQWRKGYLNINATYEETTSSNESYTDLLDEEDLEDLVYHDGVLKLKADLPREDFSRPWTVNAVFFTELPRGFAFTNTTRYQSRYRILDDTGKNETIDGKRYDIYDEVSKQSALTFDWKLSWTKTFLDYQSVELNLDIFNVFNRKIPVGTKDDQYRFGRQYWAGLTYKF